MKAITSQYQIWQNSMETLEFCSNDQIPCQWRLTMTKTFCLKTITKTFFKTNTYAASNVLTGNAHVVEIYQQHW